MSKITHKEARILIEHFPSHIDYDQVYCRLDDYIDQQEKQEKLLELYREIYRNMYMGVLPAHWEELISKKNELEKELGNEE